MQEHRAGKDQRKGSNVRSSSSEGSNFFQPSIPIYTTCPPPMRISIQRGWISTPERIFFPPYRRPSGARANLRLAIRRTTARPQEALIFQRKRASASRGKKKGRDRERKRERATRETTTRGSKSTASTRGDKIAQGFSMEDDIDDTLHTFTRC